MRGFADKRFSVNKLLVALIMASIFFQGLNVRRPFKQLSAEEILNVKIDNPLYHYNIVLNKEEISELVAILNEVYVYGDGTDEFMQIEGRGTAFEIYFKSGAVIMVEKTQYYLVINRLIGYRHFNSAASNRVSEFMQYLLVKYSTS